MCYEQRFLDLYEAVEGVQEHFQQQLEAPSTNGTADALCRLKLAVHEWMANLVRHASFGGRTPEVRVRIWRQGAHFRCIIEDNSDGFDLTTQLQQRAEISAAAAALPEGGMGLLLLKASTDHAEYTALSEERNRLRLSVRTDGSASTNGVPAPVEASLSET